MCSNGNPEPPIAQRILWSVMEGAVAFALLESGGKDAVKALQAASIAAGLPFCVLMIGMMVATYQMFIDMERDDPDFLKTQEAEIRAAKKADVEAHGEPRRWKRRLLEYVNNTIVGLFTCGKPNGIDLVKAIF